MKDQEEVEMRVEAKGVDGSTHLPDLISGLEHARSFYSSDTPDHGRFAAKAALAACIRFAFRTIPNGIELIMPLRELLDGLDELDAGLQPPMLRRKMKKGGLPIRRGIETFRATAAVLMELYVQKGMKREKAAQTVAGELNELGHRDERGNLISAERVDDWRYKVSEGGDSLGAKRFRGMCEDVGRLDLQQARLLLFESLSLIPGTRIPNGAGSDRN
jgi:hypothetical protein